SDGGDADARHERSRAGRAHERTRAPRAGRAHDAARAVARGDRAARLRGARSRRDRRHPRDPSRRGAQALLAGTRSTAEATGRKVGMSVNDEIRTPAEERARNAVRALARPAAEPAFRARLASDFARGTIGGPRTIELAGPRFPLGWLALAPAALVMVL